jgi:Ca2+-binding RTX toxin-like protein
VVNNTDANIAIEQIVAKVRSQYAPYNINIVTGNHDTWHNTLMNGGDPGDAIVFVTGNEDFIDPAVSAFGWAPSVDHGNTDDQYAFAFALEYLNAGFTGEVFLNAVARTTSHELGHTLGLEHVPGTLSHPVISHHIMSGPDARDFNHYFNFPDQSFMTESGSVQNAHQYLTQTLGTSNSPWVAVLNPGIVTISGNDNANSITVSQPLPGKLDVSLGSLFTRLDTSAPGLNSINPYSTAVSTVMVHAKGGNDTITFNSNVSLTAHVFGGVGNDTIQGGSGRDFLFGDSGIDVLKGGAGADFLSGGADNDTLRGESGADSIYGGTGNDLLDGGSHDDKMYGEDGDDDLFGRTGNDQLFGGEGTDELFGEDGNDWLDGGDELYNAQDILIGGLGTDTFIQHKNWNGAYDEDTLIDRLSTELVIWG